MPAEQYGGPIDPYSPHSLYDIINNDIPDPQEGTHASVEYEGFHIMHQGGGRFGVQLDGHAGQVDRFHADDYGDVLELVDDLNRHVTLRSEFHYQDDKEELVEWAGKIMTSDKERAENDPELYLFVPDTVPEV